MIHVLFTPFSVVGAGFAAYFLLFKHTLQIGPEVNLRMLFAAACHLRHVSPSAFGPLGLCTHRQTLRHLLWL